MEKENVIEVEHVSKSFKVFYDKGSQLKEKVLFRKRNRFEERKVLQDISFQVAKGEAIGLVGHNGCGKSTTLKLLTKIMYPDSGTITMKGRVAALIELGAGFHPDMSGRENIYTNAAIFGLTKKEIDEKIEDIIAFSELEEFIDNPVRTYSSGMYTRLAFSVAINVDADILLIDEILAVGDAGFQAKCFNRLKAIKAKGTTIVIVSHSLGQIEEICERSIWIHEGKIREVGTPKEVHEHYLDYVADYRQKIGAKEAKRQEEKVENDIAKQWKIGEGTAKIKRVKFYDNDGLAQTIFRTGDAIRIQIDYEVYEPEMIPVFAFGILRFDGTLCYSTNSMIDKQKLQQIHGEGSISILLPDIPLLPGGYSMDVALLREDGNVVDYCSQAYSFEMISRVEDSGVARILHQWKEE